MSYDVSIIDGRTGKPFYIPEGVKSGGTIAVGGTMMVYEA